MKVIRREFTVDGIYGEWTCDVFADTHGGSASVDETLLKKHVAETKYQAGIEPRNQPTGTKI